MHLSPGGFLGPLELLGVHGNLWRVFYALYNFARQSCGGLYFLALCGFVPKSFALKMPAYGLNSFATFTKSLRYVYVYLKNFYFDIYGFAAFVELDCYLGH